MNVGDKIQCMVSEETNMSNFFKVRRNLHI